MNNLLSSKIVALATQQGKQLAIAESCTGGRVAASITAIAGSSAVFSCGVVAYANAIKTQLLNVDEAIIETEGAVSAATVTNMAEGVLQQATADIAIATSGIAGPSGGSDNKPVGLVWFGLAQKKGGTRSIKRHFTGATRNSIQQQATDYALQLLHEALKIN